MELPVVINLKVEIDNPRLIQYLIPEAFTYIRIEQRGKSALIATAPKVDTIAGYHPIVILNCGSIPPLQSYVIDHPPTRGSLLSVCLSGCSRSGIHLITFI